MAAALSVPLVAKAGKLPTPITVSGAGSTFVSPILMKWAQDYMSDYHVSGGTRIEYQPVGSGAGIELIKAHKVDFGASDMPMTPSELAKYGLGQFPLVIGGVVPVVNLAGIASGKLKFTGAILADIYLGKITLWNDPALVRINPGIALPNKPISVVHRADGSGTTFNFANYLSKQSPEWKTKIGEGTVINWPTGIGAKGVQQTSNAIGYVEYAYVVQHHLTWALLQNKAGQFVAPSVQSFQAAAEGANWQKEQDFYLVLTDEPGKMAYPITATTFILLPKNLTDHSRNRALLNLFQWAFEEGQEQALKLNYVPLPFRLSQQVEFYWTTDIKH